MENAPVFADDVLLNSIKKIKNSTKKKKEAEYIIDSMAPIKSSVDSKSVADKTKLKNVRSIQKKKLQKCKILGKNTVNKKPGRPKNVPKKKNKKITKTERRSIIRGTRTPWIHFCLEKRPEIIKEFPGTSVGDVCRKLGPIWAGMDISEKQKYVDLFVADKQRYCEEYGNMNDMERQKVRMYKSQNRKQRMAKSRESMSPYMWFVVDKRPQISGEMPNATFQDIGRRLGEVWRSMNSETKSIYVERSNTLTRPRGKTVAHNTNIENVTDKINTEISCA